MSSANRRRFSRIFNSFFFGPFTIFFFYEAERRRIFETLKLQMTNSPCSHATSAKRNRKGEISQISSVAHRVGKFQSELRDYYSKQKFEETNRAYYIAYNLSIDSICI